MLNWATESTAEACRAGKWALQRSSPGFWSCSVRNLCVCVRFQVLLVWNGEHQEQTLGDCDSSCCSHWGLAVVQIWVVNKAKSSWLEACWQGGSQERHRRALVTVRERRGEQTVQFILKPHGEGAALGSGKRTNWSSQYWPESASFVTRVPLLFLLHLLGLVLELSAGDMFKRKPETIWRQYCRILVWPLLLQ